jgi:hypothetical protein
MDNYFFSKDNIERLTNHLSKSLNIKNTPESRKACRRFLESQMKSIFDKYGDKKPSKMPMSEFLQKLNQKSVEDCVKLYEIKMQKKSNSASLNMRRDKEIYGNRSQYMENRPAHTSRIMNKDSELPGMLDSGGDGNYASVSSFASPGEFITATGEMGSNMQFNGGGNNNASNNNDYTNDPNMFADKKHSIDDLERRMLERQNEYQGRPVMNMNNFNNSSYNMMGGGNISYNPNVGGGNQKPPEINFALDGNDTRKTKEKEDLIRQVTGGGMNNNNNNDMMNSFMGFDGNIGGGMGFDMMGLGLMGNPLNNNQNPTSNSNNMIGNQNIGNQMMGNQMMGNQMMGNQMMGNQMIGNQMMGNQMMGNQMMGNQMIGNQMMGNQMMGNQNMGNQNMGNQNMGNQNMGNQMMGNNFDNSKINETDLKKKNE